MHYNIDHNNKNLILNKITLDILQFQWTFRRYHRFIIISKRKKMLEGCGHVAGWGLCEIFKWIAFKLRNIQQAAYYND